MWHYCHCENPRCSQVDRGEGASEKSAHTDEDSRLSQIDRLRGCVGAGLKWTLELLSNPIANRRTARTPLLLFHTLAPSCARRFRYCFPRTILCLKRRGERGRNKGIDSRHRATVWYHHESFPPALPSAHRIATSALLCPLLQGCDHRRLRQAHRLFQGLNPA